MACDNTLVFTDAAFDQDVLNSPGPVLVDFWAEWCGPCRMIGPALEEISNSLDGKVKILKLNVDENQGLAVRFDAISIPTMVILRDGKPVDRIVGALPKPQLSARIAPYI